MLEVRPVSDAVCKRFFGIHCASFISKKGAPGVIPMKAENGNEPLSRPTPNIIPPLPVTVPLTAGTQPGVVTDNFPA